MEQDEWVELTRKGLDTACASWQRLAVHWLTTGNTVKLNEAMEHINVCLQQRERLFKPSDAIKII